MLNSIRGAMKGVFAWLFAIVGIAAFSVVGVPELQNFQQKPPIKVGSEVVTQRDLTNAYNRALRQEQTQAGRRFTQDEATAERLKARVVSDLTIQAVTRLEADKLGMTMPRSTVTEILSRQELFQNKLSGKFDEQVLGDILRANEITPRQFDQLMREDLLRQTLLEATSAGADAPRALADMHLARQKDQRTVTWLSVTDTMTDGPVDPTPEDLERWYTENPAAYTTPEVRVFSVAFLRNEDFEAGLEVPEDELREVYETNRATRYEEPERRTLYQITYPSDGKAEAAVARLRNGEPFEILAIERGTTLAASTLTDTSRKEIVDQTVAEAAFAAPAQAGTILDPVKGLFGSTVVQIVDTKPGSVKSFESVRDEIRTAILSQQTERLVYEKLEAIEEQRDFGTSLREAAEQNETTLTQFGPVDRFSLTPGGAILDGIPAEALEAAFDLSEGEDSDAIEVGDGKGFLLLTVDEVQDPALKPFEDVEGEVEAAWRASEKENRVSALAEAIAERVRAGESLAAVGDSFERAPITETFAINAPSHNTFSPTARQALFMADKGDTLVGDALGSGVKVVSVVTDIQFARGGINPLELDSFQQYIGLQLNQELLQAYMQTLQDDYGVTLNEPLIDRTLSFDDNG
ncbi:MAG: SurA N-terminal domain-containing protein [Pseudomonadota bacterium]